jgi:hypothetical protein
MEIITKFQRSLAFADIIFVFSKKDYFMFFNLPTICWHFKSHQFIL